MQTPSIYGDLWAETDEEAILLVNLGSPASPSVADVSTYLRTFLMDERVISLPPLLRSLLVKRIIVPQRAKYSAVNYQMIWDQERRLFPLVAHSASIAEALSQRSRRIVALAMRYGAPSMDAALSSLAHLGVRRVVVVPLYPHYTRSSFETAAVHALARQKALRLPLELSVVDAYYHEPAYRRALAEHVRAYLRDDIDKLIISMHGIPLSHLPMPCRGRNGDTCYCHNRIHAPQESATCYRLHCEESAALLRQDLGLAPERIELVYQSRLGRHEWMKPYFADRVRYWAREGAQRIAIVCPGFVCDCLETLYEIDVEYRQAFMQSGGVEYHYIPCLNSSESFVTALNEIIQKYQTISLQDTWNKPADLLA